MDYGNINFDHSIKKMKIKWLDTSFLLHYALLQIMLGPIVLLVILAEEYRSGLYQGGFAIVFTLLYLTFYFTHQNDKLIPIPFNGDVTKLRENLKAELRENNFGIYRNNARYITARQHNSWRHNSQLAILFYRGMIYINVQNVGGHRGYFPFSFGRNKRIRESIIKVLQQTKEPYPDTPIT